MTEAGEHRVKFQVRLLPGGQDFVAGADQSVLEAALRAGVAMASSCRNGTCRSCMCRLVSGRIRYRIDWPGLSPDEKEDGWILPCVACAQSDLQIEAPPR